ncbi:endonuclease/exonuclease/phosphatase family metal-dependent hydrolase [Catenuloplanes nepalensis]|uniref:Endonuclease/exonuclease/phosphatase family metal-dependent hydrolase n=1 Tax=Catenuloplanes nepalensis TaxID=587533 RepID=A0ABT9MU42_9ACTN|nr:endonuclease/exonuclease/phosphatase family protein [Catenuloplanes nepalensis]MDP9794541.1 endonuclease/exonuclease/phosphatase family metal-dependent hydrolase [Catenuloplanes nepalensis]
MRLATFNILHGRSLRDGTVDADRLTDAIKTLDADILGLQEVDRAQARSHHLDLTVLAADALGAGHHRFAAAVVGTPGEGFRPLTHDDDGADQPNYGIGLVSRWPVRQWRIVRLPAAPVRAPVFTPKPILIRDEPRVLLAAVVEPPWGGTITVATTHLSFVPGWNLIQLRAAIRALRGMPGPRLLTGDLNLPATVATRMSRWTTLARTPTFPSPAPTLQLDHVLLDPRDRAGIGDVIAVDTPDVPVSDHRPLVIRFASPGQ